MGGGKGTETWPSLLRFEGIRPPSLVILQGIALPPFRYLKGPTNSHESCWALRFDDSTIRTNQIVESKKQIRTNRRFAQAPEQPTLRQGQSQQAGPAAQGAAGGGTRAVCPRHPRGRSPPLLRSPDRRFAGVPPGYAHYPSVHVAWGGAGGADPAIDFWRLGDSVLRERHSE